MDKNLLTIPDAVFIFPADFIKSVAAQKCGESCYWTAEGKVNTLQIETCMEARQLKLSVKSLKLCFEDGYHVCLLENIVQIPECCDHDLSQNKIITSRPDDCQSMVLKIETETSCRQETKRKRGRPRRTDSEKQKSKTRAPGIQQDNNIDGRRYTLRGVKLSAKIMNAEKGIYDETEIKTETSDSRKSSFRESVEFLSSDLPRAETELAKSQDSGPWNKNLADSERKSKMEVSTPEDSERDAYAEQSKNENLKTKQNHGYTTCINMKAENKTVEYASLSGDGDSDDDFIPSVKRKKGRPKLKKKDISLRPKKRSLIDIGNVPTYERRKRNNEKKEECRICTKKFCDYTGLFDHVKKRHGMSDGYKVYLEELKELKVATCKICGVKLADRTLLFAHEDREHRQNTIVDCLRCQKSFRNIANLRNHVRSVHILKGEKSKLCHLCPAKFKWTATLKQHVDEIHEGNRHAKCEICHKVFYSNSQLRRHERCHGLHQSKSVICQQCGKRFLFAHNLKRHVASMHGARQEIYHCSYCGRGYRTKTSMFSHVQLVHFNLFSYSCRQCQSSFPRSKMLVDHMLSAHKVANYHVTQNPKERYKYRKNADDLYFCSYCSKGFHFKAKMVDHIHTTHADMFPHQCDQCNQGFLLPTFLLNHRLKAHGIVPVESGVSEAVDVAHLDNTTVGDTSYTYNESNGASIENEEKQEKTKEPVKAVDDVTEGNVAMPSETVAVEENGQTMTDTAAVPSETVVAEENGPTMTDTAAASLLVEVASGSKTYRYYIEAPERSGSDGSVTVTAQDIANLLLMAEQTIQEEGMSTEGIESVLVKEAEPNNDEAVVVHKTDFLMKGTESEMVQQVACSHQEEVETDHQRAESIRQEAAKEDYIYKKVESVIVHQTESDHQGTELNSKEAMGVLKIGSLYNGTESVMVQEEGAREVEADAHWSAKELTQTKLEDGHKSNYNMTTEQTCKLNVSQEESPDICTVIDDIPQINEISYSSG